MRKQIKKSSFDDIDRVTKNKKISRFKGQGNDIERRNSLKPGFRKAAQQINAKTKLRPGIEKKPNEVVAQETITALGYTAKIINFKPSLLSEESAQNETTNTRIDESAALAKLKKQKTNLKNQYPDKRDPLYKADEQASEKDKKAMQKRKRNKKDSPPPGLANLISVMQASPEITRIK
tara:strand:- start:1085 stop:1618 length:534 start_codon:yes stop_codon:yes gene_type:complete